MVAARGDREIEVPQGGTLAGHGRTERNQNERAFRGHRAPSAAIRDGER